MYETCRCCKLQPDAYCRDDGRCQYAIDHGAEGMANCPTGKCAMQSAAPALSMSMFATREDYEAASKAAHGINKGEV